MNTCTRLPTLILILLTLAQGVAVAGEVGAICRLVPDGEILDLAGTHGGRLGELLVRPDQKVEAGEVLARFSSHAALQAELDLATLEVQEAEQSHKLRLKLQALALQGAKADRQRTQRSLENYRALGAGSRSKKELLKRRNLAEDAGRAVSREELRSSQLEQQLTHELQEAQARLALAQARFRDSYLSAPVSGTILDIPKQTGELLDGGAVIRMANLQRMYALCEVYEGDLLKITPGMKTDISGSALTEGISGSVERIGREVNTTTRLARVWVLLNQPNPASQLIGMEVNAVIHL
ncbi:MAG: efflux RND transporter periplasmic adaptor subunit [Sedimenticola sp.]